MNMRIEIIKPFADEVANHDVIYMNMRIEISVITITIDGKEIESCGDTCVLWKMD